MHSFEDEADEEEADEEEADTEVEKPTGEMAGTMGVVGFSLAVDQVDALTHSG